MENKHTCLYDKHIALKAKMTSFGGFEMPLMYSSIIDEHEAVRKACGIFDVSHMGEVLIEGDEAESFVQYIFTNNIKGAACGKIFYGLMLYPNGGVVDDLLVYKIEDQKFLLVINASNIEKDVAWIQEHAINFHVEVKNMSDYYGQVAIQGPLSEKIIEKYLHIACSELEFYTFKFTNFEDQEILISRTGYTGEDGFEIYADAIIIQKIWDILVGTNEVKPCGLGCRDTLRFEVGLPLYGDELSESISPIEAGLSIFVKLDKDDFIGKEAIKKQKEDGAPRKLVGIELKDKAIPRHGYKIYHEGDEIGYVTTGYSSISTGKSVCMALIKAQYANLGETLQIEIHRKLHDGTVTTKKFYAKRYKK